MRFFKVTLILTFIVFFISCLAVVVGVVYTYDVSDRENNLYYSELSYDLLSQSITRQIDFTANDLFFSQMATDIRNYILFNAWGGLETEDAKSKINELMTFTGMTNYYYEIDSSTAISNADDIIVEKALEALSNTSVIEHTVVHYGDSDYIAYIKQATDYATNTRLHVVYYAKIDSFINLQKLNTLVNDDVFESLSYVPDFEAQIADSKANAYEDGAIDITLKDNNILYIPAFDNVGFAIYTPKPAIIDSIKAKINVILYVLFGVFSLFACLVLIHSRRVARNLNQVVNNVNKIANGDYSKELKVKGIYEFEQLSDSINIMANTIETKISELSNKNQEMLRLMVEALDATDTYTKGHSERVARFCYVLGEKLGYKDMDQLISAALLHDIGKITVPEHILNKPGKLSDAEFDIIKQHVETGHRILSKSSAFQDIDALVLTHHERYDGMGYPKGLSHNNIPLGGQILSICDVYDALTSNRPYRNAMSHERAMEIIAASKGHQFSHAIVDAFCAIESDIYAMAF